ncbi:adaptin N terminal region-domain containing protein [Nitzschia inconspicua]|uniref:Coatomer subunit beta n=1 Tax=Nitzschia inconspicua TaxID=303405 RepID=A0A9K3LRF1_9STRA|nr:adaptin N terminal region-domain containing protein [Nitzschia inconspicua]
MAPANSNESYCTFTLASDVTAGGLPSQEEIAKDLESSDDNVKKHALKAAIMAMLGGEAMPRILMQVIRFCINSDDKQLKKLCMLYWEVVPKYQEMTGDELLQKAAGNPVPRKLLPEMILVCNALMNDLNHPNEYVRGSMLRFLCKVKDEEILGPLIPSIKSCLTHRHSYVRKSAALCVFHISKLHGEHLLPDGPELVAQFLAVETDMAARRNAFLMLINENEPLAFEFLGQHIEEGITQFGDGFCLLVLELTRRVCRRDPTQKSRFVRVLFQMLSSNSAAVSYEAAWTLVSLSSAPTAVRAAAVTYTNLLNGQNDNNVQLIVLDRLAGLQKKHGKIVQELLMDIMRALSSPNPDICQKVLEITMESVTARNVSSVVTTLKRELQKSLEEDSEKSLAVRHMLVDAIHDCAKKYPVVAESVVGILMELLSSSERTSLQVAMFVRAIIQEHPPLRPTLLPKLLDSLGDISSPPVMCEGADADARPKIVTKNVVLADGTYATQTSYTQTKPAEVTDKTPKLRKMIVMHGDIFVAETLASALTKLVLQFPTVDKPRTAKTVLILCAICRLADSSSTASMSQRSSASDCQDRCTLCCRILLDPKTRDLLKPILMEDGKKQLSNYLKKVAEEQPQKKKKDEGTSPMSQADDLIHFRQLKTMAVNAGDVDLDDGADLARATGFDKGSSLAEELSHCYPLSGFADPVYAEALVTVHEYDIVLEILVINRTPNTLADLTVELSTMGDMKIVERPQAYTIGPLDQTTIRASIKVSSTETGHIFGTIVYTDMATQEQKLIHLNDIHMDIMDYIRPANCSDELFRSMWAEFEWENKVAIATSITSLNEFLDHIVSSTKMKCLTDRPTGDTSSFLAANLYARSVFGEDALVNVSVEKKDDNDGKLAGYIRIRSKTQGIALSLGDRITSVQRGVEK